mmetsp:Transcript_119721/g.343980  ORF Transcript_119721/g.343980 Transcript_119721/m.343980 type:complete len:248 (+) Transcript_119721:138-881(+)
MPGFPGVGAVKSVSQADLRRLTYRTTYGEGVPGRVHGAEDKWENMIDIHNLGKKDTKYMKFQKNEAPLLDRNACSTRRDFVPHPLGDNIINAELANSFKGGLKGGVAGLDVSAKNDSSYRSEFAGFAPEDTKSARPKAFKPKAGRTTTITGMTELFETKPMSHLAHSAPNAALAKAAETVLAKPSLGVPGSWQGPPPKTSYRHEFRGLRPNASAPMLGSGGELPPDLLPDEHPSFSMRRMIYMSPGM